jgi:hypothetical protein
MKQHHNQSKSKTIKPSNSPFKIHHSTFSEAAVGRVGLASIAQHPFVSFLSLAAKTI